jgi:hypothetical protein
VREFAQHQVRVDPRLRLHVPRVGLALNFPLAFVKEQRCLHPVRDLLDKRDQRRNIPLVDRLPRIVRLQLRA